MDVLRQIVEFLEKYRIKYCLAGGTAVIHYGVDRGTDDFDFFIGIETYELKDLLEDMQHELNIYDYTISSGLLKVYLDDTRIDIMTYITREEARGLNNAKYTEIDGVNCRMVLLEDLLLLKQSIADLEKRHADDVEMICRYCKDNIDIDYLKEGIQDLNMGRHKEHLEKLLGVKF